jgi:hypothetical protein
VNYAAWSRRRFLTAAVTVTGLTGGLCTPGLLALSRAWAEAGAAAPDVAVALARRLFPHDALPDSLYAEILNEAMQNAAGDPAIADHLKAMVMALDGGEPGRWQGLDERAQMSAMEGIQDEAYFVAIVNAVRAGVYEHPVFWKHVGYPGSSKEYGGYLERGSDDIDWLPGGAS